MNVRYIHSLRQKVWLFLWKTRFTLERHKISQWIGQVSRFMVLSSATPFSFSSTSSYIEDIIVRDFVYNIIYWNRAHCIIVVWRELHAVWGQPIQTNVWGSSEKSHIGCACAWICARSPYGRNYMTWHKSHRNSVAMKTHLGSGVQFFALCNNELPPPPTLA